MKDKMAVTGGLFAIGTFISVCSMIGTMAAHGYEAAIEKLIDKRMEKRRKKAATK